VVDVVVGVIPEIEGGGVEVDAVDDGVGSVATVVGEGGKKIAGEVYERHCGRREVETSRRNCMRLLGDMGDCLKRLQGVLVVREYSRMSVDGPIKVGNGILDASELLSRLPQHHRMRSEGYVREESRAAGRTRGFPLRDFLASICKLDNLEAFTRALRG